MSHQFGLLDRVSAFVMVLEADGHVAWSNDAAQHHFGYSLEQTRGRRIQDFLVYADQGEEVDRAVQFARTHPEPVSLELAFLTRSNDRRWIAWTISRMGEGSDELIASGVDITSRKQSEERARFLADAGEVLAASLDSRETLSTVAELSVRAYADLCIIDLLDETGTVRRIQVSASDPDLEPLAAGLMKYPSQQSRPYLGAAAIRSGRSLVFPRVDSSLLERLAQDDNHLRILRQVNPRSFLAVPLLARGRVIGSLIFISTRRSFNDDDLRSAEQLASRAALAIDNARLYQDAQKASRARDEVLSVVAHDLRSPLNGIGLSATVLQRKADRTGDPQLKELADGVQQSVSQMNRLVQDLLDKTRIDAGRLSVDARSSSPHELVSEAVAAVRSAAPSVQFHVSVPAGLPRVAADPLRIRQVFTNLLGNALKFTPEGGRIEVGARLASEMVEFWVADQGPGIAPEALPHIFERFWQGKRADTTGAGLGLAIVKGIVESHGGRVSAESAVGQGTTVRFTLPRLIDESHAAP